MSETTYIDLYGSNALADGHWGSPKKPILDFPLGHMAKPFTVTYYFHVLKEKCAGAHYLLACHTTHPDKRHK